MSINVEIHFKKITPSYSEGAENILTLKYNCGNIGVGKEALVASLNIGLLE